MDLTIEEALCISRVGWDTEEQKQLYLMASKVIHDTAALKQAQYQKQRAEKLIKAAELKELEKETKEEIL